MKQYVKNVYSKSFVFKGRTGRREFWTYMLIYHLYVLVTCGVCMISPMPSIRFFIGVFLLLLLLPSTLTMCVRRLHDVGHSGWDLFFPFLPYLIFAFYVILKPDANVNMDVFSNFALIAFIWYIATSVWLLVLFLSNSQPGENKYGPNPKTLHDPTVDT